jgi:superfamily II DNA or RNA helicase
MPDAAGLVIAGDHAGARAYASLLRGLTGQRPVVVLSDDPAATRKIAAFADSGERWMVAVRMVSEGVDIPRLAVGVYATSVSTALYFAQAVGRFVRARRRGETASVFLPSVPVLLGFAAELETERDHVLRSPAGSEGDEEAELAEALRERDTPDAALDEPAFQALNASAHFDRVLYDGGEFGTAAAAGSAEEEDFLGLPGLLEPDQVRTLLSKRQQSQLAARSQTAQTAQPAPAAAPVSRESLAALRKELNGLVGAWSHRTGQPHGVIHAELRSTCGGPPLPQATAAQIQSRITAIRRWAVSGR